MARPPARENAETGLQAPEADWYSVPPVEGPELKRALERVPLGAFTLAGISVGPASGGRPAFQRHDGPAHLYFVSSL
jgi:hypothetical protein